MQSTHIDPITKKPCRACSSGTQFKSFMSNNSKNTPKATSTNLDTFAISTTKQVHNQSEYTPFQCPANTEELGKSTWTFLHTMSAYYPESPNTQTKSDMSHFMSHFSTFYPCTHCASHLQDYIGKSPPDVDDNVALSKCTFTFQPLLMIRDVWYAQ